MPDTTKNRIVRIALAAVVAVVVLAPAVPAAAQDDGLKIAILDTEQILTASATGKKALEELTALREQKEAEGKALQDEAEELRSRLEEGRLSLSDDRIAAIQQELEDKTIELRRFQDDANRQLQKKRDAVLATVDQKVMPIINQFGAEQGYDLIFRKFESGLIFADEGVDVTQEIIRRLDAAEGAGGSGDESGG